VHSFSLPLPSHLSLHHPHPASTTMRTRTSTKPLQSSSPTTIASAVLPRPSRNPPKLIILPSPPPSSSARILNLPHPVNHTPTRYLIDPERASFHEFTALPASCRPQQRRSWILSPSHSEQGPGDGEGYVLEQGQLYIATPLDPIFLLLPILCRSGEADWATLHDHVFLFPHNSTRTYASLRAILTPALEAKLEAGMRAICHVQGNMMGDGEAYYCLDLGKVAGVLVKKAKKMVERGTWPRSLEERFVREGLKVPETGVEVRMEGEALEMSRAGTEAVGLTPVARSTPLPPNMEVREDDAAAPQTLQLLHENNDIPALLRLRTALTYLISSYIPPTLRDRLISILYTSETSFSKSTQKPILDLRSLDAHLAHIATLRAHAQALRGLSENIVRGRKHRREEDGDGDEEKKRRKEAEKKNVSLGVKKLMRADTTGMRKLSSFFGKK